LRLRVHQRVTAVVHLDEVAPAVTVGVGDERVRAVRPGLDDVGEAVTVVVGVARVTGEVAVGVELARVGDRRAVVRRVGHAVTVVVRRRRDDHGDTHRVPRRRHVDLRTTGEVARPVTGADLVDALDGDRDVDMRVAGQFGDDGVLPHRRWHVQVAAHERPGPRVEA
jgi:hypothetical protein